jgi:hypothetical protein
MIVKCLFLLVPGTRIELVQRFTPRDFKSLASTNSATQALSNNNLILLYIIDKIVNSRVSLI